MFKQVNIALEREESFSSKAAVAPFKMSYRNNMGDKKVVQLKMNKIDWVEIASWITALFIVYNILKPIFGFLRHLLNI